jgi:hypothetical protein
MNCAPVFLEYGNASVTRCALQLPNDGGSEAERAARATEVNCTHCTRISEGGGCPSQLGAWYSDSLTTNATGCGSVLATGSYEPQIPIIVVNPQSEFELAKFEVCDKPPCYNATYEAEKQSNATK